MQHNPILRNAFHWGCAGALIVGMLVSGITGQTALAKSVVKQLTPTGNATIHPIFADDLEALKKRVKFPILLPTEFPFEEPPHAIIEKAGRSRYILMLAYTAFCSGASSCRYGSVSAELWTTKTKPMKGKKIALTQSNLGYFVDGACKEGSCQDSTLTWRQGKVVYSVGIKGGRAQDLTNMANSMIRNGAV